MSVERCGNCPYLLVTNRIDEYSSEVKDHWCTELEDLDTNKPGEWLGFMDVRHELLPQTLHRTGVGAAEDQTIY